MADMVAYAKTFCLFLLNEVSGCFSLNLYRYIILNMKTLVTQLCPTLCDPMDCSLHGILQPRILEWVTVSFSRGIFSTQGLNWGLLRCRQILCCLSLQGNLIRNIMTQKEQSGPHPHCKEHSFCWYLWAKTLLITTRKSISTTYNHKCYQYLARASGSHVFLSAYEVPSGTVMIHSYRPLCVCPVVLFP